MIDVDIRDESWFLNAEAAWTDVLAASSANPLFMGWHWQSTWWTTFARLCGAELCMLVASGDDRILGIAPFYLSRARKGLLNGSRLQMVGNCWRRDLDVLTEHVDWITREECADEVNAAFARKIHCDVDWHDAVIYMSSETSACSSTISAYASAEHHYVRDDGLIDSYCVDTSGTYAEFLGSLSSNLRNKLHNRRSRLRDIGQVAVTLVDPDEVGATTNSLFELYEKRWSRTVGAGARAFLEGMVRHWDGQGTLRLSRMSVGDKVVSVILGVVVGDTEYNLQSAFDASIGKGVSPGLLHLGYELERAFDSPTQRYDLLAGGGKTTEFKSRVAPATDRFRTCQVIRGPLRKALYRFYDGVRR